MVWDGSWRVGADGGVGGVSAITGCDPRVKSFCSGSSQWFLFSFGADLICVCFHLLPSFQAQWLVLQDCSAAPALMPAFQNAGSVTARGTAPMGATSCQPPAAVRRLTWSCTDLIAKSLCCSLFLLITLFCMYSSKHSTQILIKRPWACTGLMIFVLCNPGWRWHDTKLNPKHR